MDMRELAEAMGLDESNSQHAHARSLSHSMRQLLDQLVAYRDGQGMTAGDVASALGTSEEKVKAFESGDGEQTLAQLQDYCIVTGAPLRMYVSDALSSVVVDDASARVRHARGAASEHLMTLVSNKMHWMVDQTPGVDLSDALTSALLEITETRRASEVHDTNIVDMIEFMGRHDAYATTSKRPRRTKRVSAVDVDVTHGAEAL